ncbi:hypothetical protein [Nonomuraea sp. NPDC050540]|uniref:hypothetical protein n=1 Tax=Nonomuraea sp. NPDC050540 TaxID=3364367 RepID=UPI0037930058
MLKLGVTLPPSGVDESAGVREHARHAEDLGLESIRIGDHLIPVRPYPDSTIVLATAADAQSDPTTALTAASSAPPTSATTRTTQTILAQDCTPPSCRRNAQVTTGASGGSTCPGP